jgi:cell wall-associated NlpC family hydrolase
VTLLAGPAVEADGTPKPPPPKITQGQVDAAAAAKNALAQRVGELGGQIAAAESALQAAQGQQEYAEQKVAEAVSQLRDAKQQAVTSRAKVQTARRTVVGAHRKFVQYLQASYVSGQVSGTTGSLLTAKDPGELLDRSSVADYVSHSQLDAVGQLQQATVARSNAEAAARRAVVNIAAKTKAAKAAKARADQMVAASQARQAQLQNTLATSQAALDSAQSQLATLNHDRAAYLAYKAEQARIAAAKARAARLRAQRIAAAKAAAAAARRRHHHHGGGGGGGQSAPPVFGPSAPSHGGWTPAKGRAAVARAMTTIGTPYAWAGGGANGPSYGVCDASNGAPNDCYVDGYDCSGLAMYAWGRNWDHFAATQFSEVGSFHPGANQLRPGDLIFWSFNGGVSGIHHVAIYKGHGKIIEAPFSGGYVQVSPLYEYGSFFGATRPLS